MMGDLVFIDLETTGLSAAFHEILEVAMVAPTRDLDREWVVKPRHIEDAAPKALEINRYHERLEGREDAVGESEMLQGLLPLLVGCDLVGSNPSFDEGFLMAACDRCGVMPTWRGTRDLGERAQRWFRESRRMGLDRVAARLGLDVDETTRHTAMGDVIITMTAWEMME